MKLSEKQLNKIVDRHAEALLHELRQRGVKAVGVSGGIVMFGETPEGGSPCHVFVLADANVTDSNGNRLDRELFMTDVACTMLRGQQVIIENGTVRPNMRRPR
jgi:hypothetical protein